MEKLRILRKSKKWTVYDMGNFLGITASFYSQIENKKRRLFYDTALSIASLFEMTPDELFYEKE